MTHVRVLLTSIAAAGLVLVLWLASSAGNRTTQENDSRSPDRSPPVGMKSDGAEPHEIPSRADGGALVSEGVASEVRNLGNGEPIPDLPLRVSRKAFPTAGSNAQAPRQIRTDRNGRFVRSEDEVEVVAAEADGWRMAVPSEPITSSTTLWAWREILVKGEVHFANISTDVKPGKVRLFLVPTGTGWAPSEADPAKSPGRREWLISHGFPRWPLPLDPPDAIGRFQLTVPQIAGLTIVASADGWRTASAPVAMDGASQEVALELPPAIRVSGVFRASDGTPIRGARVLAYVTIRGDVNTLGPGSAQVLQPGGGTTSTRNRDSGLARATLRSEARTGKDGTFALSVVSEGQARIVGYAPGHRIVDVPLGMIDGDRADLELNAEIATEETVISCKWGSGSMSDVEILVGDQSTGVEQPAFSCRTDRDGRLSTTWLVPGRTYVLIPMGPNVPAGGQGARWITWNGQNEVDLQSLPRSRP